MMKICRMFQFNNSDISGSLFVQLNTLLTQVCICEGLGLDVKYWPILPLWSQYHNIETSSFNKEKTGLKSTNLIYNGNLCAHDAVQ